jgi:hypothetical protein
MTKKRQFCPKGHDTFQAGRDASKRCLQCKAEDAAAKDALVEQAASERQAAFERRQAEGDRRREQEYQVAIKRGGYDAAMARWNKAYGETNGRYGLCQWEDEVDGESIGRMCYRRTTDVYCHVHNRQLERESERQRKAEEREAAAATATRVDARVVIRESAAPATTARPESAADQQLGRVQGQAPGPSCVLRLVDLAQHA